MKKRHFYFTLFAFLFSIVTHTNAQENNAFIDAFKNLEERDNLNFSNQNKQKQTYTINELSVLYAEDDNKSSTLEIEFSERAGEKLKQVGYDIFNRIYLNEGFIQGAVQDDYILGVGDVLVLILYGSVNNTLKREVSQDGTVYFKDLGVFAVAGKKLSEIKSQLDIR